MKRCVKRTMKKQFRMLAWFAALALVFTMAPVASATLLAPGTIIQAPDIFAIGDVTPGTLLADTTATPFATGLTTGVYDVRVIIPSVANVFGAGDLNYLYSLSVTTGDALSRLTMTNFANVSVDAGYFLAGGGGEAPTNVTRGSAGDVVGFDFSSPIKAGTSSFLLVIETNSPLFGAGTLALIDGGVSEVPAFSPAPEPASLLLLGSGLAGLGLWARKRRRDV